MSAVIKARQVDSVTNVTTFLTSVAGAARALNSGAEAHPEPPVDPVLARLTTLETELAERELSIAGHEAGLASAYADGEAAGRIAAEDDFVEDRGEALNALKDALGSAKSELADALSALERLALLVAAEAVEKLLGDAAHYQETLARLISHQVSKIDAASIVSIDVSRDDFADTREVAAIKETIGCVRDKLAVVDELAAGECRIKLAVGALDVGLGQQWGSIKTLLETLAADGEAG